MLDNNGLQVLFVQFSCLQWFKMFNFFFNFLEEFFVVLLFLVGLEEFYFSCNQFILVLFFILGLGWFFILWLDNNCICYLLDFIVELMGLEEFVLQGNQIVVLFDNFGQFFWVGLWKIKDNLLIQLFYEVCMKGIFYIVVYQKELVYFQLVVQFWFKLFLMGYKVVGKILLCYCFIEERVEGCLGGGDKEKCYLLLFFFVSKGIEVISWMVDVFWGLWFVVYDLVGDESYEVIQFFFLFLGVLYVLVVNLVIYEFCCFFIIVGFFLYWVGVRVFYVVVCIVGIYVDLCGECELEEKCLDIYCQIVLQEKYDVEGLSCLVQVVDEVLVWDFELCFVSFYVVYYGVFDKNF